MDRRVLAAYFSALASSYKFSDDGERFYRAKLQHLSCIDVARDLTADERAATARDLGIAALIGARIFQLW